MPASGQESFEVTAGELLCEHCGGKVEIGPRQSAGGVDCHSIYCPKCQDCVGFLQELPPGVILSALRRSHSQSGRARALAQRQTILEASPYLEGELEELRKRFAISRWDIEDAATEAYDAKVQAGEREEDIDVDVLVELEERRLLDRPDVLEAIDELCRRYRFRSRTYFAERLLDPSCQQPLDDQTVFELDNERFHFVKVETDPPVACPILRRAETYPPRLGFPQDLPKSLRSLKIVVECWTTLEDIKAAWPRMERLQRALPGYRERMRGRKDLDRDILLHWLVYVQGHTVGKAIEILNEHRPEEDFYPDEATLGKSLRELDEQMKPIP